MKKAHAVHGEKYDYSQVRWNKVTDKITIVYPEHGPFEQAAINHYWAKQGCPKCGLKKLGANKRHSLEKFLQLAKEKHGDKYDYSLVTEYKNGSTPVKIICKTCGKTFEQKSKMHIKGHGCTYCAPCCKYRQHALSWNFFIVQARCYDEKTFAEDLLANQESR